MAPSQRGGAHVDLKAAAGNDRYGSRPAYRHLPGRRPALRPTAAVACPNVWYEPYSSRAEARLRRATSSHEQTFQCRRRSECCGPSFPRARPSPPSSASARSVERDQSDRHRQQACRHPVMQSKMASGGESRMAYRRSASRRAPSLGSTPGGASRLRANTSSAAASIIVAPSVTTIAMIQLDRSQSYSAAMRFCVFPDPR